MIPAQTNSSVLGAGIGDITKETRSPQPALKLLRMFALSNPGTTRALTGLNYVANQAAGNGLGAPASPPAPTGLPRRWVCLERTVVQSMSWPARTPALPGLSPDLATMPEAGCGLILTYDLPYKPVSALGRAKPVAGDGRRCFRDTGAAIVKAETACRRVSPIIRSRPNAPPETPECAAPASIPPARGKHRR